MLTSRSLSFISTILLILTLVSCSGGGGSSPSTDTGATTADYTFIITPVFPDGLTYNPATGTLSKSGGLGVINALQAGDKIEAVTITAWNPEEKYPEIQGETIYGDQLPADGTWVAIFTLDVEMSYSLEMKVTLSSGEQLSFHRDINTGGEFEVFINANLELNFGPEVWITGQFLLKYNELSTTLTASARDPDGDELRYLWATSCSLSSATTQQTTITKGSSSSCMVKVIVMDTKGAFAYDEAEVLWEEAPSGTTPEYFINVGDVLACTYTSTWTTYLNGVQADQETVEGTYGLTATNTGTLSGTGYGGVSVDSGGNITWIPGLSWPISGSYDNDAGTVDLFELSAVGTLVKLFSKKVDLYDSGSMGPGLTYEKTGTTGCSKQ